MRSNEFDDRIDQQTAGRDTDEIMSETTSEEQPPRPQRARPNPAPRRENRPSDRDLVSLGDIASGAVSFGIIGVGQGGGRIAQAFHDLGNPNVLAINTAAQDLDRLEIPGDKKLRIGAESNGAGKDPAVGQRAADLSRHEIMRAISRTFSRGVDHLVIAFGAGGGTGAGAAPTLVDLARSSLRQLGVANARGRVGAIVALPTRGEHASQRIARNTAEVTRQMTELAAAGELAPLVFVDNERTGELASSLALAEFWPTVNNAIAQQFQLFNHLSQQPSAYSSFDTADYRGVLEAGGCHVLGVARLDTTEADAIADAVQANLRNAIQLDGFRLSTAKTVGAIVVGGRRMFRETPGLFQRISGAFDALTDLTGRATVHRGIYEDDQESLRVFTIVGGLEPPTARFDEFRVAA